MQVDNAEVKSLMAIIDDDHNGVIEFHVSPASPAKP